MTSSENFGTFFVRVPLLGLSAFSSASSAKLTISDCQKSSVSLTSNDSVSLSLPLFAGDSSSGVMNRLEIPHVACSNTTSSILCYSPDQSDSLSPSKSSAASFL